ncbi:MAG TPA: VWA domain-containing protein, partial [Candidatus Polarisedimenticolia bacterium]|nr:VWA domain-containing protein [Candidatus Polarisedimenticolia bacterium]
PAAGSTAALSDPRRIDLRGPLPSGAEEALARELPRLIREIRLTAGRRQGAARRGRLWPARMLRRSLATGGVPFAMPARAPRPRRPEVILLVDVSWSVRRAAAFFLAVARALVSSRRKARVYLFVDRLAEATTAVARWRGSDPRELASLLESVPGLDPLAASDYGRAFYQAAHARQGSVRARRRDTVLVVLGDARSNMKEPQAWAFEDLAARCSRVLWLDPEPAELWGTGDSVLHAYLPSCDVVCEARDLDGIARGIAEIVRSL